MILVVVVVVEVVIYIVVLEPAVTVVRTPIPESEIAVTIVIPLELVAETTFVAVIIGLKEEILKLISVVASKTLVLYSRPHLLAAATVIV